jgi:predicted CoA-binding protein
VSASEVPADDDDARVAALLAGVRTVAVLGVSDRFTRPSFHLAAYLLDRTSWDVALINPHVDETLGRLCVPTLALLPTRPDLIVVYRSPSVLSEVVDEAAAAGARALWFPAGADDGAGSGSAVPPPGRARAPSAGGTLTAERVAEAVARAADRARAAGLIAVTGRDLKTEHARWCR